ncbi:Hint domain-containing protein [Acidisphaera sp. L21]|uniref:Hint domain-containing protein n=1 Tax=Acidisphaera sp. L21 TaxID=1641851 RepID=UPI00131C09E7|nr:Hint domain-containing protein [Acidisphaera sp. L21]
MANRIWRGGNGDWYDASNWLTSSGPANYPLPGDTVTIASGDIDLIGSEAKDNGTFDADAVTLGTSGGLETTLTAIDAILNHNFTVTAAGSATILAVGQSIIEGSITAGVAGATFTLASVANGSEPGNLVFTRGSSLTISGTETLDLEGNITVEAGSGFITPSTVNVVNNGTVSQIGAADTIDGSLAGTGTWELTFSTSLLLAGSVSAGQDFTFGLDGRLRLADPTAFDGSIGGFTPGNLIDFTTISASNVSYDAATGTLTLNNGTGSPALATIDHVTAAAGTMVATSDGNGGTLVSYTDTSTRQRYENAGADDAMRSNVVRDTMTVPGTTTPITGAGVKIGIISDSFDEASPGSANTDAANGYLPESGGKSAVTVLTEGGTGSSDEGRAMAELIYQAAPGAQLYFSAAGDSEAAMASSINGLVAAGCNIIVDDISFLDTPMYQVDGTLDTAVSNAIGDGVDYFTSAGNFGDSFLDQSFAPATTTLHDGTVANEHVFSNGTAYESITVPASTSTQIDLQWTAAYEGLGDTGAPDALTFKVFDASGTLVATSTQASEGALTTDISASLPTSGAATPYQLAVYLNGGQVQPSGFKLVLSATGNGSGPGGVIDDPQAASGSGDIRGQELIPGVNTVGATYYGDSAAFGQTPDATEYYSDSGTGTLLYASDGTPLATPESAGKVDFVAPDGVNTTVPELASFFGTSAAAPDAAAVAALMLQAEPSLTTAQVSDDLAGSAISLGLSPAAQGAGLIQADRAVALAEGIACYVAGTQILTVRGEVAVEALAPGDMAVTANGAHRPIIWMGHRRLDCRNHPRPATVWPVRVEAGAFGRGLPHHDLWLSPGHAVLIEGALLPVERLINGATVTSVPVDSVTYWHVELDRHDVIFANGAAAESYLDTGNRSAFGNGGDALALHPDFSSTADMALRKTFPVSKQATTAARAKILGVAGLLGYALTADVALHILVDGVALAPSRVEGNAFVFELPPAYGEAWLASSHFVPAQMRPNMTDLRRLGVRLSGLWVDGTRVPLANLPDEGWHKLEVARGKVAGEARWTNGRGRLPEGGRLVRIELIQELRAWVRADRSPARATSQSAA